MSNPESQPTIAVMQVQYEDMSAEYAANVNTWPPDVIEEKAAALQGIRRELITARGDEL